METNVLDLYGRAISKLANRKMLDCHLINCMLEILLFPLTFFFFGRLSRVSSRVMPTANLVQSEFMFLCAAHGFIASKFDEL